MHHPACSLVVVFSLSLSLFLPLGKGLRADPCPGTPFLLCGGIARSLSLSLSCLLACKACGLEAETENALRWVSESGWLSLSLSLSLAFVRKDKRRGVRPCLCTQGTPHIVPLPLSLFSLSLLRLGCRTGAIPPPSAVRPTPSNILWDRLGLYRNMHPPGLKVCPLVEGVKWPVSLAPTAQQLQTVQPPQYLGHFQAVSLSLSLSPSLSLSTLSLLQHRQRAIRSSERPRSSHLVLPRGPLFLCKHGLVPGPVITAQHSRTLTAPNFESHPCSV